MRWFINNLSLILLSMVLAASFWAVSSLQDDPIIDGQLVHPITVVGADRLGDVVLNQNIPSQVISRIRAPRSVVLQLQGNQRPVVVDLSQYGVGRHEFLLAPVLDASPLQLIGSNVITGSIFVEPILTRKYSVKPVTVGTPALGFRLGTARVEPQELAVRGTQDVLDRVKGIEAVLSVEGARASLDIPAPVLRTVDAVGNTVDNLRGIIGTVTGRVPLEQLSNYRDLPVVVKWRGQPAEGYAVADIQVEPLIVTVFGREESVQGTRGFIETLDVVIANAQSDLDERANLNIPPGVSLVDSNRSVRVRMKIRPIIGSRTVRRKPTLIGLTSTLSATVQPLNVDVVLNGSLPRLNNLTEDDVRATVDVVGLDEGTYQLSIRAIAPDGVTVASVVPGSVQVELTRPKRR